jgi:hypothetical protein
MNLPFAYQFFTNCVLKYSIIALFQNVAGIKLFADVVIINTDSF